MRLKMEREQALSENAAAQIAPLALAYIGDCVFDMFVRTALVMKSATSVGLMHAQSSRLVNARAQAGFARMVFSELTEREQNIFMRGRNAKSTTVPKNMSVSDYHHATALEAVFGYLYLTGQDERLNNLFERIEAKRAEE